MRNKYILGSHISERKFRVILRLFSEDLTATQISHLVGVSPPTINKILKSIRQRIAEVCEESSPFSSQIEVDESYFGARLVRGKRGRGASGKMIVFGIFKRDGKVYTEIVPDVVKKMLQGIIRGKVALDSVIRSDQWRGYNGLVDLGYKKRFRVNHGDDEFVTDHSHINGIEGFWGWLKID